MDFSSKMEFFLAFNYIVLLAVLDETEAINSFVVSFQSDADWSTDHWMRYNKEITGIEKEFTICHWEKLRYFSTDVNTVWTYCYERLETSTKLRCWYFDHKINYQSGGRKVELVAGSPSWSIRPDALKFRHRQWNHICFFL